MFGQPDLSSHLVSFVVSLLCAAGLLAAVQLGRDAVNPHVVDSTKTSVAVLVINGEVFGAGDLLVPRQILFIYLFI